MKGHVLSIFVFCAVLATAYSLKCYSCSGSEEKCSKSKLEANKASMSVDCSDGECIRTWVKKDNHNVTNVDNFCSSTCEEIKETCDAFKDGKCAVGCCDSDYCNAGSSYSSSVILMIVTSALGLALLN